MRRRTTCVCGSIHTEKREGGVHTAWAWKLVNEHGYPPDRIRCELKVSTFSQRGGRIDIAVMHEGTPRDSRDMMDVYLIVECKEPRTSFASSIDDDGDYQQMLCYLAVCPNAHFASLVSDEDAKRAVAVRQKVRRDGHRYELRVLDELPHSTVPTPAKHTLYTVSPATLRAKRVATQGRPSDARGPRITVHRCEECLAVIQSGANFCTECGVAVRAFAPPPEPSNASNRTLSVRWKVLAPLAVGLLFLGGLIGLSMRSPTRPNSVNRAMIAVAGHPDPNDTAGGTCEARPDPRFYDPEFEIRTTDAREGNGPQFAPLTPVRVLGRGHLHLSNGTVRRSFLVLEPTTGTQGYVFLAERWMNLSGACTAFRGE